MTYFYMDTDGVGATAPYDTWAKAAQDLETALGAMSAGDILYVQGAAVDTAATARLFTSAGTIGNPCKIIGVKDSTTNTGASVVASDLAVQGTDTLTKIQTTGGSNIAFDSGYADWFGLDFDSNNQINSNGTICSHVFDGCRVSFLGDIVVNGPDISFLLLNCDTDFGNVFSDLYAISGANLDFKGGVFTFTAAVTNLFRANTDKITLCGVDLSGFGNNTLQAVGASTAGSELINCLMPVTYTAWSGTPSRDTAYIKLIGCNSNTAAKGATTSYQDYYYEDIRGTIEDESTIVRTGGADDGASGFSYAMTPRINNTLEGSNAALKSPWMNVWLSGGANTLTVYFCNDATESSANLFHEDDVWVEFYTPDASDTAQHDQTFDAGSARLLTSTIDIATDSSTWGSGGNNKQKIDITVTTGFEGWGYARLHFAKRYAATPATLYLDPKIVVT